MRWLGEVMLVVGLGSLGSSTAGAQLSMSEPVELGDSEPYPIAFGQPIVATDGTSYLVQFGGFGTRVRSDGRVVDRPALPIGTFVWEGLPNLAWSGTTWLMTGLRADGIAVAAIDPGVSTSATLVAPGVASQDHALSCAAGRCLLALAVTGRDHGIYTVPLARDGSSTTGTPLLVAGESATESASNLRLAVTETGGLAIWQGHDGTWLVRAVYLDADGAPVGEVFNLARDGIQATVTAGLDDSGLGEAYLVTWLDVSRSLRQRLAGTVLSSGATAGPSLGITYDSFAEGASAAWRGDAWVLSYSVTDRIEARRVQPDGTVGTPYVLTDLDPGSWTATACTPGGCLTAFDGYDGDRRIGHVRAHDPDGAFGATSQPAAYLPPWTSSPRVSSNGCELRLTWQELDEPRMTTWDIDVDPPDGLTGDPIAFAGGPPPLEHAGWADATVIMRNSGLGGWWLDPDGVHPFEFSAPLQRARVLASGRGFVVVATGVQPWGRPPPLAVHEVRMIEGSPRAEALLSSELEDAADAARYGDGVAAVVRSPDGSLYARWIGPDGTVGPPLLLAEAGPTTSTPMVSIGCGDDDCLVIRTDPREDDGSVLAVRFDRTGVRGSRSIGTPELGIPVMPTDLRVAGAGQQFLLAAPTVELERVTWLSSFDWETGLVGEPLPIPQATEPQLVPIDFEHAVVAYRSFGRSFVRRIDVGPDPAPPARSCTPVPTFDGADPPPDASVGSDAGPPRPAGGGCDCGVADLGPVPISETIVLLLVASMPAMTRRRGNRPRSRRADARTRRGLRCRSGSGSSSAPDVGRSENW